MGRRRCRVTAAAATWATAARTAASRKSLRPTTSPAASSATGLGSGTASSRAATLQITATAGARTRTATTGSSRPLGQSDLATRLGRRSRRRLYTPGRGWTGGSRKRVFGHRSSQESASMEVDAAHTQLNGTSCRFCNGGMHNKWNGSAWRSAHCGMQASSLQHAVPSPPSTVQNLACRPRADCRPVLLGYSAPALHYARAHSSPRFGEPNRLVRAQPHIATTYMFLPPCQQCVSASPNSSTCYTATDKKQ